MRAAWLLTALLACDGSGGSGPPADAWQVETFDDCPDLTATCTPGDGCARQDWEHGCSCGCGIDGHWSCRADTIGSVCSTCGTAAPGGACTPDDHCSVSGPSYQSCDCTCGLNGTWACTGDCQ